MVQTTHAEYPPSGCLNWTGDGLSKSPLQEICTAGSEGGAGPRGPASTRHGLYGLVKGTLEKDPLSGHLFIFCNRRCDRIKVLSWDGSGLWCCAKRLERGCFHWPHSEAGASVELTQAQLNLLLGGLDLKQTHRRRGWLE